MGKDVRWFAILIPFVVLVASLLLFRPQRFDAPDLPKNASAAQILTTADAMDKRSDADAIRTTQLACALFVGATFLVAGIMFLAMRGPRKSSEPPPSF